MSTLRTLQITAAAVLAISYVAPAAAQQPVQSKYRNQAPTEEIAVVLYERGLVLFEQDGDYASAKTLFIESLELSSTGMRAAQALRMLRSCNQKLGLSNLESGRPGRQPTSPPIADEPIDPYEDGDDQSPPSEQPLDPYGEDVPPASDTPVPTANDQTTESGAEASVDAPLPSGAAFIAYGGAQGFVTGAAVLSGESDGGAVVLGLVAAGGGAYLAHALSEAYDITDLQARTISSAGTWGMVSFAHLGNLLTGEETTGNAVLKSAALGGIAGDAVGYWYGKTHAPDAGTIALVNSLGVYGTAAGLFLGVAIDPPKDDAYALNAVIGSTVGIGAGLYLAEDLKPTRRRMLYADLGAASGALAPWLLYPILEDGQRVLGFLSTIGIGFGAYLGWKYGPTESAEAAVESSPSPSPALVQRDASGRWGMGTPILRPNTMPSLAEDNNQGALSLGIDVLSGRF